MEAPGTGWVALPSTSAFVFLGGQIVEASQRPGNPPVGLIIPFGSSYLVNRAPWPLGAGEGSVVFGEEAVSLSDPCPHRQAALQSSERGSRCFLVRAGCEVWRAGPLQGREASLSCDPPAHQLAVWPLRSFTSLGLGGPAFAP